MFKKLALLFFCSSIAFAGETHDGKNQHLHELINYVANKIPETGKNIKVAVIDSGLSPHASALNARLHWWENLVDENGGQIDYDGHGTAAADIIVQFAREIDLIAIAVAKDGVAHQDRVYTALLHAFLQEAQVINLSLSVNDAVLKRVEKQIGEVRFHKALIVQSAGNDNYEHKTNDFPNVIRVAALKLSTPLQLTSYSARGDGVLIAAPAGDVNDGIAITDGSLPPRLFNGTSAAAPVVCGIAALLAQKHAPKDGIRLKELVLAQSQIDQNLKVHQGRYLSVHQW